jgi:DNA repair protein RadD
MRTLRPYQEKALDTLRAARGRGIRSIVLEAPTGAGKTLVASTIVQGALDKGNRVAFVVPALALIDQTVEEFYREGVRDVGVIQANHHATDWSKPVQVCSIQTIAARGYYPEAKVVIMDECHIVYDAHKKWLTAARDNPEDRTTFIGLSATPWTRGLGRYYEEKQTVATIAELIEQGYLSPFRVWQAPYGDLSKVRIVAGEYVEKDLSAAMQTGDLVADIIETWKKLWGKDKTLVFAVDCNHAMSIQERFKAAGINAAYQDGTTPADERRQIKTDFHSGICPVVVSVGTLIMGVDWDVRCISYCRPTRSEMRYVQAIGRGLRTADGKSHLVLLDHSPTTHNLGFVTDISHDELDDGRPKRNNGEVPTDKERPLPVPCPSCAYLMPKRARECPNCGHANQHISHLVEERGELVETTANGAHMERARKNREYTMEDKRSWYSQLRAIEGARRYKEGWAAHKFKAKFGVWPNSFKYTLPTEPTYEVMAWVKNETRKWRNAQAKQTMRDIRKTDTISGASDDEHIYQQ